MAHQVDIEAELLHHPRYHSELPGLVAGNPYWKTGRRTLPAGWELNFLPEITLKATRTCVRGSARYAALVFEIAGTAAGCVPVSILPSLWKKPTAWKAWITVDRPVA